MAYDDDWSSFMTVSPDSYGADMAGFQDQSIGWGDLGGGDQYSNLMGNLDSNYLNFGVSDPYSQYPGGMPTFVGSPNESPFSGMEGAPTESSGGGWMDALGGLGSKALNWLGSGTNVQDLAGLGLGALGMYGNWRAGADQRDDARGMSEAELALRRELGLKGLDLQRELGLGRLGIDDRGMGVQENQFRLGQGTDDMASKALGMQLLINRGRMTADQANPWLNQMYSARQQMFRDDPVIGEAWSQNPFRGVTMGQQLTQPTSPDQFFRGLDPSAQPPAQMASGGMYAHGGLGQYGLLRGGTSGQADKVNANLSHGEYVWDADTVSALGDGNTEAGAAILDQMRERIRAHKRSAPADEIPPPAKDPMKYLGEV